MDVLLYNGEEIVLVNVVRDGSDATADIYAVPVAWATLHNINQYDWSEITDIPSHVYSELVGFPKLNITRVWEI